MIVGNFTPDTIDWVHQGMMGKIAPGDVTEFDDGRAKHILNKWGPRGLVRFMLDDNMEQKQKESMKVYTRFWTNQIVGFNQGNESRKNERKAYVFPTEQLADKAQELGIELLAPWSTIQQTDNKQLDDLKAENTALKSDMSDMRTMLSDMKSLMQDLQQKPATPVIIDTTELTKKFRTLQKDTFQPWVLDHLEELAEYPEQVQRKAQEKWLSFYKEPWPLEAAKA